MRVTEAYREYQRVKAEDFDETEFLEREREDYESCVCRSLQIVRKRS